MNKLRLHIKLILAALIILIGYILIIRAGKSVWDSYKNYDLLSQNWKVWTRGIIYKNKKRWK